MRSIKRITAAIAIICRVCNSNDNTGSKIRKANSAYYPEVLMWIYKNIQE